MQSPLGPSGYRIRGACIIAWTRCMLIRMELIRATKKHPNHENTIRNSIVLE